MPEPLNPYAPPAETRAEPPAWVPLPDARLATRWQRFWGKMVDYAVLLVPMFVWMQLVDTVDVSSLRTFEQRLAATLMPMVVVLGAVAGVQWWLIATTGQSIGKKLLKTRIVKDDGSAVGFVTGVLLREWAMFAITAIPGIGPLVNLADHLAIFGEERKTLHDRIASTKVIDTSVPFQTDAELAMYAAQDEPPRPRRKKRRKKKAKPTEPVNLEPTTSEPTASEPAPINDDGSKPADP